MLSMKHSEKSLYNCSGTFCIQCIYEAIGDPVPLQKSDPGESPYPKKPRVAAALSLRGVTEGIRAMCNYYSHELFLR